MKPQILKRKKSLLPKLPIDEEEFDDTEVESEEESETPALAKRAGRKGAITDAFANTPLTPETVGDGNYTGQLQSIRLTDSAKSQAVFVQAKIDIGKEDVLEARWMLIKPIGEANEFGIQMFRESLKVLGDWETEESRFTTESLEEAFEEISQAQPNIRLSVANKNGWTNVKFLKMLDSEDDA